MQACFRTAAGEREHDRVAAIHHIYVHMPHKAQSTRHKVGHRVNGASYRVKRATGCNGLRK